MAIHFPPHRSALAQELRSLPRLHRCKIEESPHRCGVAPYREFLLNELEGVANFARFLRSSQKRLWGPWKNLKSKAITPGSSSARCRDR